MKKISKIHTVLVQIAYDGSSFCGYQIQQGEKTQRTVQGVLEESLMKLYGCAIKTAAAGRTDAGVHATGQYVSFQADVQRIPAARIPFALNNTLPKDVSVIAAREVSDTFHARYSALKRHYRYRIFMSAVRQPWMRLYVWRISEDLHVDRLNKNAALLIGEHDFAAFAARTCKTKKTVRAVYHAEFRSIGDNIIEFHICANGFLWRMVRSIVGTLVELEIKAVRHAVPPMSFQEILQSCNRKYAGMTAPACGLFLDNVEYAE